MVGVLLVTFDPPAAPLVVVGEVLPGPDGSMIGNDPFASGEMVRPVAVVVERVVEVGAAEWAEDPLAEALCSLSWVTVNAMPAPSSTTTATAAPIARRRRDWRVLGGRLVIHLSDIAIAERSGTGRRPAKAFRPNRPVLTLCHQNTRGIGLVKIDRAFPVAKNRPRPHPTQPAALPGYGGAFG